ncbi:ankyrin repeat-containing protein BDA1-like [Syzygium oleosum]|uniref:ankyrin repeat-containing protein BDA1-like n=1 Tax=Syzygium oleosum TaxID=219896 RepID=UPI0011D1F080|nr:ankyrin repeat-containing protein BDA1-like [Syzygium oleosum]
MDPRLQQAIEHDDVDELHSFIVEEPKLLDRACKGPFPNTPLHVVAAAGKTQVAMEMAILKRSFTRKLNPEGYSPMHLALQHEHYSTVRALMTLDPKLIRVRGRCGITPLHYVAGKEGDMEVELLAEFLATCNSSINDLTSRCETAVHVAVKNHNLQAFKVLLGWLMRVYRTNILGWKDQDGNTVLHIAASEEQLEIFKLLIGCANVNVNAKNFQDKTALEIFQDPSGDQDLAKRLYRRERQARFFTPTLSLSQFFSTKPTVYEKCKMFLGIRNESARNIILIMSTLIATASYQAALTPPGGYWQDNFTNTPANSTVVSANTSGIAIGKPHHAGDIIMHGSQLSMFTIINSMVFWASMSTIWATAITLLPDSALVLWSIASFGIAFLTTIEAEFPKSQQAGEYLVAIFYDLLMTTAMGLPLYVRVTYVGVVKRIDATGRHPGNFLGTKDWK